MTENAKYKLRYVNTNSSNYPVKVIINGETITISDSSFIPEGASSIPNGFEYEFVAGRKNTSNIAIEYTGVSGITNTIEIGVSPSDPITNQPKLLYINGSETSSSHVSFASFTQADAINKVVIGVRTKAEAYESSEVLVSGMCSLENVKTITLAPDFTEHIDGRLLVDIYSGDTLLGTLKHDNVSLAIPSGVNTIKASIRDNAPDSTQQMWSYFIIGNN